MPITNELAAIGVSVFVAQEPNVHWDTATNYQLYMQCKQIAPQIALATSCSQDQIPHWYQPRGTIMLSTCSMD